LFHFNFLLICCNIHLLISNNHLSLVFKFLLGMCHPTTKTLKILKNNQSRKEKQKLESPQQWWLPPLLRNFKLP
jgi:hypothetical protein